MITPDHDPLSAETRVGHVHLKVAKLDRASYKLVFCADVSDAEAALMATTQRPISELAFGEATADPAWKLKPRRELDDRADRRRVRQPMQGLKEEPVR
jgi:hypothetical protein